MDCSPAGTPRIPAFAAVRFMSRIQTGKEPMHMQKIRRPPADEISLADPPPAGRTRREGPGSAMAMKRRVATTAQEDREMRNASRAARENSGLENHLGNPARNDGSTLPRSPAIIRSADLGRATLPDPCRHVVADSPMLSTPRSSRSVVSQSGSISGTEDSNRSV